MDQGRRYPSDFAVQYAYSVLGHLTTLKDAGTQQALWTSNARDAALALLQETAGNGVVTNRAFDAETGRVQSVQAGASNAVADFAFGFDTLGNLTSRSDANQSLSETFTYDNLNRLTEYAIAGGATKAVAGACPRAA